MNDGIEQRRGLGGVLDRFETIVGQALFEVFLVASERPPHVYRELQQRQVERTVDELIFVGQIQRSLRILLGIGCKENECEIKFVLVTGNYECKTYAGYRQR